MRKAVDALAMMALIVALIAVWMRPAPLATESVTVAGARPSTAVSPFELMSRSSKALPNQFYRDPF